MWPVHPTELVDILAYRGGGMEPIDTLNQRLIDEYGLDSSTGQALFRIVWANDQTEKRRVNITDTGVNYYTPSNGSKEVFIFMGCIRP